MKRGKWKAQTAMKFSVPFYDLNRVYLWGPEDPSDPVVYINVQNDI